MSDLISRQAAIDAMKDMYRAAEKWLRDATDDVTKARAESCMATLVEIKLRIDKTMGKGTLTDDDCMEAAKSVLGEDKLPAVQPDHVADIGKKAEKEDCISRQTAVDALKKIKFSHWFECGEYLSEDTREIEIINSSKALETIEALPSAQPERKKGRWLRYGEDGYPNNEDTVFWQCDQCLEQYTGRTKRIPNFCPECGADMRGGDTE